MAKKKLLFFMILLFANTAFGLDEGRFQELLGGQRSSSAAYTSYASSADPYSRQRDFLKSGEYNFYVFVTLSMPNLKALVADAKRYNAALVIQGLKDNSFMKTANHLKEILKEESEGILIDPTLFRKYNVKKAPTFVIATDDAYDKLSGNVSIQYALNKIASDGELGHLAKELLTTH